MNWNLHKIKGTRDAVKLKVSAEKVPAEVKAFISANIDSLPGDVLGCELCGYCNDSSGRDAVKTTRNIQITIESYRLG
jgi:hypothetical protein